MQVPFGLSGPLAQRAETRRLGIGAALALGVHALLLLGAAWKPERALQIVQALRDEVQVQVEPPSEPAGAPAGGPAPLEAKVPAARPRVAHRVPVLAPPRQNVAPDPAPAAITSTSATNPEARVPVPGNSRDAQRLASGPSLGRGGLGDGSGAGGLFGNGRFVGDGPGALKARICFIPETTRFLKEIPNCSAIYEQFLDEINVPPRDFSAGFPGFEDRTEYFAVDIAGTFSVSEAGSYRFRLKSDDGSQLFIDNRLLVDNDGIHDAISKRGEVELRSGRHRIRVWYFQGMKFQLALQLFVTPPGGSERLFSSSM
jgi:PA14 domain